MTGHPPGRALLDVLRQPLESNGLDLEDVEIATAGRRRLVRVFVDKDTGISLDEVADATSLVSALLDDSDVLGDAPYTLEVTSPGVDRPLTAPRHWRRNVGRLVKVEPHFGEVFIGRIVEADEERAVLAVDEGKREVRYSDVAKSRVEIEFNRPRSAKD